jgi:hypothetical protein
MPSQVSKLLTTPALTDDRRCGLRSRCSGLYDAEDRIRGTGDHDPIGDLLWSRSKRALNVARCEGVVDSKRARQARAAQCWVKR